MENLDQNTDQEAPVPQAPAPKPVNLVNPRGDIVSVPQSQAQQALASGYQQASPDQVDKYFKEEKYGSASQQAISFLEGAGEAGTFGLSTGIEKAFGAKSEDIEGRREVNPITHGLGQVTGLVGSSLLVPGGGAAGVLEKAGAGAAEGLGLGLEGASTASKIGAAATKMAVENAMVQSGDEISKMLTSQNPGDMTETSLANIGLSGLIGAGLGATGSSVSELWKSTFGSKTEGVLSAVANKVNGGDLPLGPGVTEAIDQSGMKLNPVLQSALSDDPLVQKQFQILRESKGDFGQKALNAINDFKSEAGDKIAESLGKTPEEISELPDQLSKYNTGQTIRDTFIKELQDKLEPIEKSYQEINDKFKDAIIPDNIKSDLSDKIGQFSIDQGLHKSPSSPEFALVKKIQDELDLQTNAQDLKKYISNNLNEYTPGNGNLNYVRKNLKGLIRDAEEDTVTNAMRSEAPDLIAQHAQARADYRDVMTMIDGANDRLHVGRYDGPKTFIQGVKDLSPEKIVNRLTSKEDAGLFKEVLPNFQNTLGEVQNFNTNQFLKKSITEGKLDISKLFGNLDNTTPEMRDFAFNPEAQNKIGAIKTIWDALPDRINPSGSGGTAAAFMKNIVATAVGSAALLAGHNPALAAGLGYLTKIVGSEAPDAVRYSLLKYLGSNGEIDGVAFKTMVNAIQSTIKGENLLSKASSAIFKAGSEVLPQALIPTQQKRDKLDKMLQSYQTQPQKLLNISNDGSSYLPEQNQARGETAMRAVNILNSMRPVPAKSSPLDADGKVNPVQQASYDRALDIAEQPLMVLKHLNEGTLNVADVGLMKNLYPNLYGRLTDKLTSDLVNHVSKENPISYQTQLGLSKFLGQPMVSSAAPDSIMQIQSTFQTQPKSQQQGGPQGGKKGSLKNIRDIATLEGSNIQNRSLTKWD